MRTIQFKVGAFFVAIGLVLAALLGYLLYAKDVFELKQAVYLTASDAEDIDVGMPLVYSGIAIGTVRQVDLTSKGQILVKVIVPEKQAKWLRSDSFFWLDRPLLGKAKIRVYSHFLTSPPLAAGATRPLYGVEEKKDSTQLAGKVGAVLENVEQLTRVGGKLDQILTHLETVSGRMTGHYGVLEGMMGSREQAERVVATLDQAHVLVRRHAQLAKRIDTLVGNADRKLFARDQAVDQLTGVLAQTSRLLAQAGDNLKKVDAILSDVKGGSQDIPHLRDEVERTLNKTQTLIDELNALWPISKPKDLALP